MQPLGGGSNGLNVTAVAAAIVLSLLVVAVFFNFDGSLFIDSR